ncbi:hypothetical protein [uncultured Methanobrevibacter sp.]|uniref:hypothetical protein n=1 Tax=uncultured Methanobrevibacter sp. TaxID=253161 RepID=UPI002614A248
MAISTKQITIILIIALILGILIMYYTNTINPIITGLAILAVIVIILNFYLLKVKK